MTLRSCALGLVLLGLFVACGSAAPLVWTLNGVTFIPIGPGSVCATASGSFWYDPATNTYSNVNITTTTGCGATGATFGFVDASVSASGTFLAVVTINSNGGVPSLNGTPVLVLRFAGGLTAAGGTVALTGNGEGTCSNADCSAGPPLSVIVGSVIGSAIPTPSGVPALSPWAMAALAVLLTVLGWFGTRRIRRNEA